MAEVRTPRRAALRALPCPRIGEQDTATTAAVYARQAADLVAEVRAAIAEEDTRHAAATARLRVLAAALEEQTRQLEQLADLEEATR